MTSRGVTSIFLRILLILVALFTGSCRTWSSREERAAQAYNRGNALRESGRPSEAEAAYIEALEQDPGIAVVTYNLALTLVELGRYDEALTRLERLLSADPGNISVLRALAWTSWQAGDTGGSMEYYTRALAVFPADIESLRGYSEVLEYLERYSESVEKRRFLVELEDTSAARMNLADTLSRAGNHREALETWQTVLFTEPENRNALDGAYSASMELNRFHDALAYLHRVSSVTEKPGDIWWNIARLNLLKVGDYQRGIDALKKALDEGYSDQAAFDLILVESPPAIRPAVRALLADL